MAESNLPDIIVGIKNNLETATLLKNVQSFKPDALSSSPLLYFVPDRFELIQPAYGEMAFDWTFLAQATIPLLNSKEAWRQIVTIGVQVMSISGLDLSADGAIVDGQVTVTGGEFGIITDANKNKWMAVNFTIKVIERVVYEYAN